MNVPISVFVFTCAVAAGIGASFQAAKSSASGDQAFKTMSLQQLTLVDHDGRTKMSFDADAGGAGPSIRMFDTKGNWQMDIGSTQNGSPCIAFVNGEKKLGLSLGVDERGEAYVSFAGPHGEGTMLYLGVGKSEDGKPKGLIRVLKGTTGEVTFER